MFGWYGAPQSWRQPLLWWLVALVLAALPIRSSEPSCRNPLFRLHWAGARSDGRAPSSLNVAPAMFANLTICNHWKGKDQCCNPEVEPAQVAAFEHRKAALAQDLAAMRACVAQMLTRKMTVVYENAAADSRARFDKALDTLHGASRDYPSCLLTLLRYVAGMICFMCDPQWESELYAQDTAVVKDTSPIFLANRLFRSVSLHPDTCSELWAACRDFGTRIKAAWRYILESELTKHVSASLPNLDMYFEKSLLCDWARNNLALHPLLEIAPVTAKPTMPALPIDTTVSTTTSQSALSRRLAPDGSSSASSSNAPMYGRVYILGAFHQPNEVKIGEVPSSGPLTLSQRVGSQELGTVGQVAIDRSGVQHFVYFSVITSAETQEIMQYKYVFVDENMVLQSPTAVWPSQSLEHESVIQMRTWLGEVYIATGKGRILKLNRDNLLSGARTDGFPLFSVVESSSSNVHSSGQQPQITGLSVQAFLFWSTSKSVYMGPLDGSSVGEEQQVFDEQTLTKAAGSQAVISDLCVDNSTGIAIIYIAVYSGGVNQMSSVYNFHYPGTRLIKLQWSSVQPKLVLASWSGGQRLFISSGLSIYSAPTKFNAGDTATEMFSLSPSGLQDISDIAVYFIDGLDCNVSAWTSVGTCSTSCGHGKQRQERSIITPARVNGKPCPSEMVRYVDCNLLDCLANAVDCQMSQWLNKGICSATCGAGQLAQQRSVLIDAEHGGRPCPEDLERTVACNLAVCGGLDYVVASMPTPGGMFVAKVEGIVRGANLNVERFQPDIATSSSMPVCFAIDSKKQLLYSVTAQNATLLTQWYIQVSDTNEFGVHSPATVWTSNSSVENKVGDEIVGMTLLESVLYVTTRAGLVVALQKDDLQHSSSTQTREVYNIAGMYGNVHSISASGTYLAFATSSHVILGSTQGNDTTTELLEVVSPDYLRTMSGSSASAEIIDAKLTMDGSRVFLLVWDHDEEALGLYSVPVVSGGLSGSQIQQLRYTWTVNTAKLAMMPSLAFVYTDSQIWEVPAALEEDATAVSVYKPSTAVQLSALGYAFVKGVDCNYTTWLSLTTCSTSCGGGVIKQSRQIISQPSHGGTACPTQLSREVPCNEQPCPSDCVMSSWKAQGNCSVPCGGGSLVQTRQVLQAAGYGGVACPTLVRQTVACNAQPCQGIDCVFSAWLNYGSCSLSCGTGEQRQYRTVVQQDAYGGKPCNASATHQTIPCNPTPCGVQGFDPIAAGKLTGFDFDVSENCEQPELCATMAAFEIFSDPKNLQDDLQAAPRNTATCRQINFARIFTVLLLLRADVLM